MQTKHQTTQVKGRAYPWGTVEVENEEHCDFVKLRHMLIRSHMMELWEHTNNVLYEAFRSQKASSGGANDMYVSRVI
jgi:septin 7